MANANIVRRLIAFLKKPDACEGEDRPGALKSVEEADSREAPQGWEGETRTAEVSLPYRPPAATPWSGLGRSPRSGSRLDALVMRAIQQFDADQGYVIRREQDGHMRYCTGRDTQGRYVPHTAVSADKRAVLQAVSSGESQLFVRTLEDNTPVAVLCGPLWDDQEVIGVLYLNNPARSRLYRGVFDVFCDQTARLLHEGVA